MTDPAPTSAVAIAPQSSKLTWRLLPRIQERVPILQVIVLFGVFAYGAITLPGFASLISVKTILILAALVGIASTGQTLVVLTGGFDMSISGFIVAGSLFITEVIQKWAIPFGAGVLILIAVAAPMGAVAGWLCHRYRIPSLIVTLAIGSIALGMSEAPVGGELTSGQLPSGLGAISSPIGKTFGVPVPPILVIWIAVAVLVGAMLHVTSAGRRIYHAGANPTAADLALVNTRRVWMAVYAFSAVCAVLTGVLVAGFAGSVDTSVGDPYLFQSLAAVIVGGTAFGGPGDYTRTIIGVIMLTVLNTVLVGHGLSQAGQQIMFGLIILVAVGIYGRERRVRDRV